MFSIVGAGFGLYGYLPAIINLAREKVILSEQYRPIVESRSELVKYLDAIEWKPSITAALERASGVIIAIPPLAQVQLVGQALAMDGLMSFIVEKPIAPTPAQSSRLIEELQKKTRHFRAGYTFLYTDWYVELRKNLSPPIVELRFTWLFKADHVSRNKETWKRYHSLGGGVLRFYGIHVIATLASLGYSEAVTSDIGEIFPDQPVDWCAQFDGAMVPRCKVHVCTNADENIFRIETFELGGCVRVIHDGGTPFPVLEPLKDQDGRIPVLERLLRSLDRDDEMYMRLYHSINDLWGNTEQLSLAR